MWRPITRALLTFLVAAGCAACGAVTPIAPTAVAPPVASQGATQVPAAVALSGGTLQLYAADQGSAHLQGTGFDMTSEAVGNWPQTVAPGTAVSFGGNVTLSDWGNVTLNGAALRGDASGPGAGVLSGTYRVVNASSGPMFLNNCCMVLQVGR